MNTYLIKYLLWVKHKWAITKYENIQMAKFTYCCRNIFFVQQIAELAK